ncbi:unnamed protein product [Rodentolepis nana]|uniref:FoP_duplication domain-containing protein n=1 Tax=Rodentolepis nana TaxID=102285 RepID=A0A0R3T9B9_RODNA|nr:unnamed protein product [Rodentolepis nana]
MRPRTVLPIRLYSSSSLTLNERFRRLENLNPRKGVPNPLGIRRTNPQRTPATMRLGQRFTGSLRGRGRPLKKSGRSLNQNLPIPSTQPPPHMFAARRSGFRGRGRGAVRAIEKRRGNNRRFNRGGGGRRPNNADNEKVRADLDKQLSEYMESPNGN